MIIIVTVTMISDDCRDNEHNDYMHVNIYSADCCIVVAVRVMLLVVIVIVIVVVIIVMMEALHVSGIDSGSVSCNDNLILLIIMIRGSDRNDNIACQC